MGHYLIKTQRKVFEARSIEQLAQLAESGLIEPGDMIKALPAGAWIAAAEHETLTRVFDHKKKQTMVTPEFRSRHRW